MEIKTHEMIEILGKLTRTVRNNEADNNKKNIHKTEVNGKKRQQKKIKEKKRNEHELRKKKDSRERKNKNLI